MAWTAAALGVLESPQQGLTPTEVSLQQHQGPMPRSWRSTAPYGWQKRKQSVPGLVFTAGLTG